MLLLLCTAFWLILRGDGILSCLAFCPCFIFLFFLNCGTPWTFLFIFYITKTCLYIVDLLKPQFYIEKLVFTWVYIILFLFVLQNIDCGYSLQPPRRGEFNEYPQYNLRFAQKCENYQSFYLKIFSFLVVIFFLYI